METTTAQREVTPTSLVAFFNDMDGMDAAYQVLQKMEYPPVSITMAMAEKTYQEKYASSENNEVPPKTDAQGGPQSGSSEDSIPKTTKASEGFTLGVTAGAGLGALALLGASVVIPGVALIGPLAATITGASAGATVGGLAGLLFGSGHPEDEARKFQERVKDGKFMIRVSPKSIEDANEITQQWKALGGEVEVHN